MAKINQANASKRKAESSVDISEGEFRRELLQEGGGVLSRAVPFCASLRGCRPPGSEKRVPEVFSSVVQAHVPSSRHLRTNAAGGNIAELVSVALGPCYGVNCVPPPTKFIC